MKGQLLFQPYAGPGIAVIEGHMASGMALVQGRKVLFNPVESLRLIPLNERTLSAVIVKGSANLPPWRTSCTADFLSELL